MRKKKEKEIIYLIKRAMREENMLQLSSALEFVAYNHIRYVLGLMPKVRSQVDYVCCTVYMMINNKEYEIAHYHHEDYTWCLMYKNKVSRTLVNNINKVVKETTNDRKRIDKRNNT